MNILALDAATEACSVAVLCADEVREQFVIAPREHAQRLLPMAQELLAQAGLDLSRLDAIAVGRGPGAFTGIRIAMGLAQGLALGADLPIAPISCLQAQAWRSIQRDGAQRVLVVQDARMQEVYSGAFSASKNQHPVADDAGEVVCAPAALRLPIAAEHWHIAGNGWAAYPEQLQPLREQIGRDVAPEYPHAEDIARLGQRMVENGASVAPELAIPSYVRNKVANEPNQE